MAIRSINNNLKTHLENGDAFSYCHLVQFEIPKLNPTQEEGDIKYAYLTDASTNIEWNNITYYNGKLISTGRIREGVEAKADTMSITMSGVSLGSELQDTFTFTSSTITSNYDLIESGFSEGDVVKFYGSGANASTEVRLTNFSNGNKTVGYEEIYDSITSQSSTYTMYLSSTEISGLFKSKSDSTYANYINRNVYVYKAFFDPDDGSMLGDPILLFKGLISGVKADDDVTSNSIITWNLTSHWGDFVRVNGRITSDASHRALNTSGVPDRGALLDPAYANDLGFSHSEGAINLIATYNSQETRYKEKKRGGLAGLFGLKKLKEYEVTVENDVDLRFNLSARYLPVVYGVRRIDGIPVFVDTDTSGSSVYAAYAICEGEISAIYDIYFDDQTTICTDAQDESARSTQTANNTVDVICTGRMDKGDTLNSSGNIDTQATTVSALSAGGEEWASLAENSGDFESQQAAYNNVAPKYQEWKDYLFDSSTTGTTTSGVPGIIHEQTATFQYPMHANAVFHAGLSNQEADRTLSIAAANGTLTVGTKFYKGSGDYWGASHRLLDTAYLTAKYTINEADTQVPSIDFVVKGKICDAYNYDYSYCLNLSKQTSPSDWGSFSIGDTVSVYTGDTAGSGTLLRTVKIAHLYSGYVSQGELQYRVRFDQNPIAGSTTNTFYVTNGSNYIYLETYDRTIVSGSVSEQLYATLSGTFSQGTYAESGSTWTAITANSTKASVALQQDSSVNSLYAIAIADTDEENVIVEGDWYFEYSGSNLVVKPSIKSTVISTNSLDTIYPKNAIAVDATLSNYSNLVNNYYIVLSREVTDSNGNVFTKSQKRKIIGVNSTYNLLFVDRSWDAGYLPTTTDTYRIISLGDRRVSNNPVVQLADYLTNKRYGRGLELADLDVLTFAEVARECDTRSNVTVVSSSNPGQSSIGSYYEFDSTPNYFYGKLKGITTRTYNSTSYYELEFENVIGKLGRKYQEGFSYPSGTYLWSNGYVNSGSGQPTSTNVTITLSRVSGTGATSIGLDLSTFSSFDGNPIVKSWTNASAGFSNSGYGLYDADDVKYWRYVGWDSQDQEYVTRHQVNAVIDTSNSVFNNINNMLSQFSGILRYVAGKYELDIFKAADSVSESVRNITQDDIIGKISIEDTGAKSTYNTLTVGFPDPHNKYSDKSISYFNSDYVREDKGVVKKGDLKIPDITNYFNARINAKQYLETLRYNLNINFTLGPEAIQLLAGTIVKITYPRFNWTNKYFRITDLTLTEDCLVQVTATEHNDSAFIINSISNTSNIDISRNKTNTTPSAPTNLNYTLDETNGGTILTWSNASSFNNATGRTEIWAVDSTDVANINSPQISEASLIGTVTGGAQRFIDTNLTTSSVTRFYWIRHATVNTYNTIARSLFSSYTGPLEVDIDTASGAAGNTGLTLYKVTSSSSTPSGPSGDLKYNFSTGALTEDAVGNFNGWSDTPSNTTSSNPYLWIIKAVALGTSGATEDTIESADWSTAAIAGKYGEDGIDYKSELIQLFQINNSLSAPSVPSNTITWEFSTHNLSSGSNAINNGWSLTSGNVSSSNKYLWKTAAFASASNATTDDVDSGDWSSPVLVGAYGDTGSTGASVDIIFKRSSTQPATPSPSAGVPTGWYSDVDSLPSGTDTIWASTGTKGVGATNYTWGESVQVEGSTGAQGLSIAELSIFIRSSSDPSTPTGGSFTFPSSLTAPTGWSGNPPSGTNPVYISRGFAESTSSTGTDSSITWSTPVLFVQNGTTPVKGVDYDDGATGPRIATGYLYYQLSASTAPASPTISGYNFSTGAFSSISTNWARTPPTFAAGNANKYWYIYYTVSEATFGGTQTIVKDPTSGANQGIGFSGLVTFTSGSTISDGTNSLSPLESGDNISQLTNNSGYQTSSDVSSSINTNNTTYLFYPNTTKIDGGKIETNTIEVNSIKSGSRTDGSYTFGLSVSGVPIQGSYNAAIYGKSTDTTDGLGAYFEYGPTSAGTGFGLAATCRDGVAAAFAYQPGTGNYSSSSTYYVSIADSDTSSLIYAAGGGTEYFKVGNTGVISVGGSTFVTSSRNITCGTIASGALTVTGAITATGDVTAFYSSDRRLKDNIVPISNALEKVTQLGGYEFDWNHVSPYEGMHDIGVIAQEVLKVAPEAVARRENDMLAVRYEKLVPLLIEAIKDLKAEIEELKRGTSN